MKKQLLCAAPLAFMFSVGHANDSTPQMHPLEAACIEYEMSGQMQNGTMTRCHRDYGYETYEIQNVTMGMAGFTQTTNQHSITVGDTIYTINLDTNAGTQTTNPLYAQLSSAMENSSPEEMSETFLSAMGFTPTGQTKTIAGESCTVYNSSMMGTGCFTDTGLMLEQTIMGNTTVATSVTIGDGGDDANYTLYQNVPITEGPDIGNIMDMMNSGNN